MPHRSLHVSQSAPALDASPAGAPTQPARRPIGLVLSIGHLRPAMAPHPLELDRTWRALIAALAGLGPLAACLLPGRVDVLCLASATALAARVRQLRSAVPRLLGGYSLHPLWHAQALRAAVTGVERAAMDAKLSHSPLAWRWSTAWERVGLRRMDSAGAADLHALLPQGGWRPQARSASPRHNPGEALCQVITAAALAAGLHPTELRVHSSAQIKRTQQDAIRLATLRGWDPKLVAAALDAKAPHATNRGSIPDPAAPSGPRLAAARRVLALLAQGGVAGIRPASLRDLAAGRQAVPTTGPAPARLARRVGI